MLKSLFGDPSLVLTAPAANLSCQANCEAAPIDAEGQTLPSFGAGADHGLLFVRPNRGQLANDEKGQAQTALQRTARSESTDHSPGKCREPEQPSPRRRKRAATKPTADLGQRRPRSIKKEIAGVAALLGRRPPTHKVHHALA
jgi:hypothetical protein